MSCLLLFSILFSLTVLCGTLFSNQLLFLIFKVDLYLRLKANKLQHGHAFVLPTFAQRLFVVHSFPVCNFVLFCLLVTFRLLLGCKYLGAFLSRSLIMSANPVLDLFCHLSAVCYYYKKGLQNNKILATFVLM